MLSGFIATMRVLTTAGGRFSSVCIGWFAPTAPDARPVGQEFSGQISPNWLMAEDSRPGRRQFSLLIAFELPTIPSPTTFSPFRHDRFLPLLHRRGLPRLSPGQTFPVGGIAVARSRVRTLLGGSPTGLAESSSLTLRTGLSPQVALHPPSRERSYHCWIQAGNVSLEGTFTLLFKRLHRRTSTTASR